MAVTKVLSKEDGNLSQSSIITTRKVPYRDIDLTFAAKPNGELYVKRDASAVQQSLKNLILTNHFEKPFLPFFGGNIRALLFELADDEVNEEIRDNIIQTVQIYEPRALIQEIDVKSDPDRNSISVTIEYQILNSSETLTFTTSVSRLR
jgi:phage baseplate assembly protein W